MRKRVSIYMRAEGRRKMGPKGRGEGEETERDEQQGKMIYGRRMGKACQPSVISRRKKGRREGREEGNFGIYPVAGEVWWMGLPTNQNSRQHLRDYSLSPESVSRAIACVIGLTIYT